MGDQMEDQMERLLTKAGEVDDTDGLVAFIKQREVTLRKMANEWFGYTPLHVACAANCLNLVEALMEAIPDFADKTDVNGLSPLHIAAARGHGKIATALEQKYPNLRSVKGPENRIPLHYAIENGKLDVMEQLLCTSFKSVEEITARKETVLHLAVKNDQFEVVKWLLKHLKEHNMMGLINEKDNEGNTALHFAVAAKNSEVVKFMLDKHAQRYVVVDVNVRNNCGKTPLDCLGREAGDSEIRDIRGILNAAGAKHGTVRHSSLVLEGESRTDIRNALLVVAGLIASATYQSVLQPPKFETKVDETLTEGFRASYASYMTGFFGRDLAYIVFITGNTFGLLVSVQMIICLTRDLRIRLPMLLSMTLMVQTYYCHTYYLPFGGEEGKEFGLINAELLSVLPLMIPILLLLFQRRLALALEFYLEKLSLFDHLRDMYYL